MSSNHSGFSESDHLEMAQTLKRLSNELSLMMSRLEQAYGRDSKAFRTSFAIDLALGDLKEELAAYLAREWSKADGSMGVETIVKARGVYEKVL